MSDCVLMPMGCADPTIRRITRWKKPTSVMGFSAMVSNGLSMPPIIFSSGTKINSKVYQTTVLKKAKAWMEEKFELGEAVSMQNGAPAHTSRSMQAWLTRNLGEDAFWKKTMWPPSSPDCNPLDFLFWNELVTMVCKTAHRNHSDFVWCIEDVWEDILKPEYVAKTCQGAWKRLRHVVE